MSYQLIELKLENYQRIISDTTPLHVSLGAISGNDTTTLKVSVVVSALSVGATADLSIEESLDGGLSWVPVTASVTGTVNATGTWAVWINENSGIISPTVRLSLTPLGAGDTFYISKAYRTFNTDGTIVPRANISASGFATEATLSDIDTAVGNIETDTGDISTDTGNIATDIGDIETILSDRLTGSFVPKKFDYVGYTDGGATETWVYKTGGSGGTTQKTVTVSYTDATKAVLVSIAAT